MSIYLNKKTTQNFLDLEWSFIENTLVNHSPVTVRLKPVRIFNVALAAKKMFFI
jgi:hypothetical protein